MAESRLASSLFLFFSSVSILSYYIWNEIKMPLKPQIAGPVWKDQTSLD